MNKALFRSAWALVAVLAGPAQAIAGDIVVVMGPGATALTKDQVANVYLGRSNDLRDLRLVDLPDSNPTREACYKKATGRDLHEVKAMWSRITFTGQGLPPKEMADAAAVKKAVAADRKAIGYIDTADVDASVTVVLTLN
jgi:hypothetical protein